jgi:CDP-glycerol glycerophosphotransferase
MPGWRRSICLLNERTTMDADKIKKTLADFEQARLASDLKALSMRVRKRPVVLFFGRATFSDNTKYAYLRALARERQYEVYWCGFDPDLMQTLKANGLPCLNLNDNIDLTIDLLLHAAVALFSINPNESLGGSLPLNACLEGASKIQLWHGVSVKHLMLELISYLGVRDINLRQPFELASRADVVLSTSSRLDAFWRSAFGVRQLLRAGYPRNEVMVRTPDPLEMIGAEVAPEIEQALRDGRRRNLLVVPTWQRGASTFITEPEFLAQAVLFARRHDVNLFFKMHPTYYRRHQAAASETEHLHLLGPGVDLYPWLSRFDALVTDYSSIMFDFLHTGKPVLGLDIAPDAHQNFEPDFSLIPQGEFRHRFTPETMDREFKAALFEDTLQDGRIAMREQLFETDPANASDHVLALVDRLVEQALADDVTVLHGPSL